MASAHDRKVINSILNPTLPIGEGVHDDVEEDAKEIKDPVEEDTEEIRRSKSLEAQGIDACQSGMMSDAYSLLTRAIEAAPRRPSCYNNRAQILRLQGRSDEALVDLDKALGLSGARGRTGSQALVQRASIHRKDGREDDAIVDFRAAAELGSKYAKSVLVGLNPYAAMCNKMLKNVFTALESGEETVENPFKDVVTDIKQG